MSAYFIDSNVVIYALGRDHPYRDSCIDVLRAIVAGQLEAYTSVEVLQEIVYRYYILGELQEGIGAAGDFAAFVEVLSVTERDVERAFDLFRKYNDLPPRDLIHLSTMMNNGLKDIITADKHFDQIREVRRRDPSEF